MRDMGIVFNDFAGSLFCIGRELHLNTIGTRFANIQAMTTYSQITALALAVQVAQQIQSIGATQLVRKDGIIQHLFPSEVLGFDRLPHRPQAFLLRARASQALPDRAGWQSAGSEGWSPRQ